MLSIEKSRYTLKISVFVLIIPCDVCHIIYFYPQQLTKDVRLGEPQFQHFKQLSERMIELKVFEEKKLDETEKYVVNYATMYDDLRREIKRKDKRCGKYVDCRNYTI